MLVEEQGQSKQSKDNFKSTVSGMNKAHDDSHNKISEKLRS